jgi:hypothetical protein
VENELPTACCGVNLFGEAFETDAPAVKLGDAFYEVFERSSKPVKPPDNEGIPVPDEIERLGQSLTFRFGAAYDR